MNSGRRAKLKGLLAIDASDATTEAPTEGVLPEASWTIALSTAATKGVTRRLARAALVKSAAKRGAMPAGSNGAMDAETAATIVLGVRSKAWGRDG